MLSLKRRLSKSTPLSNYTKGYVVKGGGKMGLNRGYKYTLECEPGKDFDPRFVPVFTPQEMLTMGVFEGKYLNDCTDEFPQEWYRSAFEAGTLSPEHPDVSCNYFGVPSRQPLGVWIANGWAPARAPVRAPVRAPARAPSLGKRASKGRSRDILADPDLNPDERGWFQWYCRYWLGRRIPALDDVQIGRWRSFARHAGAVKKGCTKGDLDCRVKERQALLQWSYNPFL